MSYYDKHVFFCCNQRDGVRTCCNDKGASQMRDYAKAKVKALGLSEEGPCVATSTRSPNSTCVTDEWLNA